MSATTHAAYLTGLRPSFNHLRASCSLIRSVFSLVSALGRFCRFDQAMNPCLRAGWHHHFVPKPLTSGSKAEGRFGKQDFIYVAASDEYRCPAGQLLTRRHSSVEDGMLLHCYYFSGCQSCSIQKQCTTGKERRIKRWEHEAVVDAMQARLDHDPTMMRRRRQTVEHPFGTLKYWMGSTHFLTKTLPRVSTEMSLHVLAYNLKRMMSIFGIAGLLEAIRA